MCAPISEFPSNIRILICIVIQIQLGFDKDPDPDQDDIKNYDHGLAEHVKSKKPVIQRSGFKINKDMAMDPDLAIIWVRIRNTAIMLYFFFIKLVFKISIKEVKNCS